MSRTQKLKGLVTASLRLKILNDNSYLLHQRWRQSSRLPSQISWHWDYTMRGYGVCHRESGIAGCDARITQIEHLGPNRYELVRVVDYWVRVESSRSWEGPTHLCVSSCRTGVLSVPAGSMGSFSGHPPSMFGATLAALHLLMCEYTVAVR